MPSRRYVLSSLAVVPAITGASTRAALPTISIEKTPVIHHALFWLNNSGSLADRKQLVLGLETLRAIPQIRHLHIGLVAATEQRDVVDHSFDVSELMFFDNLSDQATYQSHPIHQAFIKNFSHLWRRVAVYDASLA